jgi:tRNA(Ile)-lysidine synthase
VLFVPTEGAGVSRFRLARAPVFLASRQGGERLRPDSRRPRRALRKLLQAAAVPPWERRGLPLLWCGGELAWVGGVGIDEAFACSPGEEGLAVDWRPGGRQ